jgi:hypothetical protein
VVCLVLAALLTSPAALLSWGEQTLNDTGRYVDTVGPLVSSPEVQDAIATQATAAIRQQVDVEAILNDAFSGVISDAPRLQELVGPFSYAINALIDSQVRQFIASDAFKEIWVTANTRTQQTMLRLLRGEDVGAVSLQGDQVVLDVSEVIDQVKRLLAERGLTLLEEAPIPAVDRQIVLLDAPQLKQVRTAYSLGNPIARWLVVVVLGLYVAGFALARRRARMTIAVGVALAANAVLLALALTVGRQLFMNQLSGSVFDQASGVFYQTLLAYLVRARQVMLGLGLILVVVGWYVGSAASAALVRETVAGALETAGGTLAGGPASRVGDWVAPNVQWLRVLIGAVGVMVLTWGNGFSLGRLTSALILVLVLLAAAQVLIGASRRTGLAAP